MPSEASCIPPTVPGSQHPGSPMGTPLGTLGTPLAAPLYTTSWLHAADWTLPTQAAGRPGQPTLGDKA